jgi:broad specificity phosphatase PhoE
MSNESKPENPGKIQRRHFFFLRHAETDWNHKKLCQGQTDIPLNENGLQEAKSFALASINLQIDCIVTSPLSRALETAKQIHQVHPKASFQVVSELSERSWGSLEGISSEEMYSLERKEMEDPDCTSEKGVEPRAAFRERIIQGISIAQTFHQHPLIVSHGRLLFELCHILDAPPLLQVKNCKLLKINPSSNGWDIEFL